MAEYQNMPRAAEGGCETDPSSKQIVVGGGEITALPAQHGVMGGPSGGTIGGFPTLNAEDDHKDLSMTPIEPTQPDANGRINRSRIIKDTSTWYNQSYLVPHEAIRYWMEQMDINVATNPNFDPVKYPWKVENFYTFWHNYYYAFVHHHHDIEEQLMTPWMESKGLNFPPKIMHDHVKLMAALDKVNTMETRYNAIRKEGAADMGVKIHAWTEELKVHIRHMNEDMRDHLAEEESMYPPALRDGITEKEYKKQEHKIIKTFPLSEAAKVMPLIGERMKDWGGIETQMAFEKSLPGPLRYLLNHKWKPNYFNYTEPLLKSLVLLEKPLLVKPKSGCCTVQ